MHSVTNHLTRPVIAFTLPAQRDRLPGIISGLDFTLNEQARRNARPNRVRHPTDCMFASGCSPPRLTATQLPSATRIGHLLGEDFHFTDRACFQAHSSRRKPESSNNKPFWTPASAGVTALMAFYEGVTR
jgi:hypothetical protein